MVMDQLCAATACVVLISCGPQPSNTTQWQLTHSVIDGMQATNVVLSTLPPSRPRPGVPSQPSTLNCAGTGQRCHMWGPGFGDRNGVFRIDGGLDRCIDMRDFGIRQVNVKDT